MAGRMIRSELAGRELARRQYADYLAYVHGRSWKRTRLSEFLANKVQRFLETESGNAYDILVIETPPQHGKSMTLTESLPSWVLGRWPEKRVIIGSYNEISAERFARRNKEKLKAYGKTLFGVEIGRIDRTTEFEITGHTGRLISRGMLSGVTGNPAELMILDDPIKNRMEADSAVVRRRIWEEWQNSFKSRLAAGAKVILIMTPWHEDDLAARLLKTEQQITLLNGSALSNLHIQNGAGHGSADLSAAGRSSSHGSGSSSGGSGRSGSGSSHFVHQLNSDFINSTVNGNCIFISHY